MGPVTDITLREVRAPDLDIFFEHHRDPEGVRMAAFIGRDPHDRPAFNAHWAKILSSPAITQRTIVCAGQVTGQVGCYPHEGNFEVTYWLGREFWGRGIATQALQQLLLLVKHRPLMAGAAADNVGSLRVLQKCGFKLIGRDQGFARGRGEVTEECRLRLDAAPAA